MKFLHKPFEAKAKDKIIVTFDKPTRILLLHTAEFARYKKSKTYKYRGGHYEQSPVEFEVPFDGVWHAVIEEGTHYKPLPIKGSAKLVRPLFHTLNGMEQMETHEKVKGTYDDTLE